MDLEIAWIARPLVGRSCPATVLAALSLFVGCSQLSESKRAQSAPLMLGSTHATAADSYLAHHAPRPRPEAPVSAPTEAIGVPAEALAARTRSTAHPLDAVTVADVDTGTPVKLGAPEPLATPSNPDPLRIAANAPDLGRSTLDAPPLDAPASIPKPKVAAAPAGPTAESVIKTARQKLDRLATYQVALHRQERVNGTLLPEEDVLLSVRRNPKAVRLEWPSGQSKGREVIYSASENDGKMHINMPLMPRIALPPDSPLVMQKSRHPITEAGLDNIVANLESSLNPPAGMKKVEYAGVETPREVGRPCHKLTRVGPKGEQWTVCVDQATGFPALVKELDAQGQLMECYVFRDVKADLPDLAAAGAFDVNQRWGPGGFLSRIARAGADAANSSRQ